MRPFTYERAASPQAAVAAFVAHPGARFIGGGTNLLDLMKLEVETPAHLIDISRLALDRIDDTPAGGLRIGACVRNSALAEDRRVRERYPVLARALLAGASAQLRNMATVGGNLLQRTRCPYFYERNMPCNKREPGAGCAAIAGLNRMHAVLGGSPSCIAVNPSDMAVALRVLDADIHVLGADGSARSLPIAQFYRLPGDAPEREHALLSGELIEYVELPPPAAGVQVYRKIRDRASYAFALVSVAAIVEGVGADEGAGIEAARVALGGVAPLPWRVADAERHWDRAGADPRALEAGIDALLAGAVGYGHNDFKIPLARRVVRDVLQAAARAGSSHHVDGGDGDGTPGRWPSNP